VTLFSLCGPRRKLRPTWVADAVTPKDPTGTRKVRVSMRGAGDRRWQILKQTLRQALIEHDFLGLRGIGRLPHGNKVEGFTIWLHEEMRQKVFGINGSWLRPYVQQAADIAQAHADKLAPGGRVDPLRVSAMQTLAISELAGICAAAEQQITRCVAQCMMANASPTKAANAVSGVISTMRTRTRAMSEDIVARTHATSTLSAYRSVGVTKVGLVPEHVTVKQTAHGKVLDEFDPDQPRDPEGRWTAGTNPVSGKSQGVETSAHGYNVKVWPVGGKTSRARMKYRGDPAKARLAREAGFAEPKFLYSVAHQSEQYKYTRATQGGAATEGEAKEKALAAAKHLSTLYKDVLARADALGLRTDSVADARKFLGIADDDDDDDVEVITAGDNDVCIVCEDISNEGPYDLDTAEGLIPAHPWCRCAFVPVSDKRFAKVEKDALDYSPDQPRDPDGKWTEAGGGSFEGSSAAMGEDEPTTHTREVDALREGAAPIQGKQLQALEMYTANSGLFNSGRDHPSHDSAEADRLDDLIRQFPAPHDLVVYRQVGWAFWNEKLAAHVGKDFTDPNFMSTTLDPGIKLKPGSYMEIHVPKGEAALPIGSLSNYPEEAEVLLPRGSRLHVESATPLSAPNTMKFVATVRHAN
jgi:ADP-ribosyltransferase exoenzyme